MHCRQHGDSGDPFLIWPQLSADLHRLASHQRRKSNYWWNNLQVKGPLVCIQPGCKSSKPDAKESEPVLRPGCPELGRQASCLALARAGHRGLQRDPGHSGPVRGKERRTGHQTAWVFVLLPATRVTLAYCLTSFLKFPLQKHWLTYIEPQGPCCAMYFKYKSPIFTTMSIPILYMLRQNQRA